MDETNAGVGEDVGASLTAAEAAIGSSAEDAFLHWVNQINAKDKPDRAIKRARNFIRRSSSPISLCNPRPTFSVKDLSHRAPEIRTDASGFSDEVPAPEPIGTRRRLKSPSDPIRVGQGLALLRGERKLIHEEREEK
jgi:hypothetical protein